MKPNFRALLPGALLALALAPCAPARAAAAAAEAAPAAAEVGALGDPERIAFEGNRAIPAEEIRRALRRDFDFLMAAHPRAPREAFLRALREAVQAGYWNSGFPEAKVAVALDAAGGKVTVRLEEGPQYRCGAVRVTGAKRLPADKLCMQLISPRPPPDLPRYTLEWSAEAGGKLVEDKDPAKPDEPVWKPGEPAPFGPRPAARLTREVKDACAELGWFFPELRLRVEPGKDARTADLAIEIADEGPPGVIGDIQVAGNAANSREEIVRFLGIQPGGLCDRGACERLTRRLLLSGRFLAAAVRPAPPEEKAERVTLAVRVIEAPGVPKLSEELPPTDKALLRLRDWLQAAPDRGDDLVVAFRAEKPAVAAAAEASAILSMRGGMLVSCRLAGPAGRAVGEWTALMSPGRLGCYAPASGRKFVVETEALPLAVKLGMTYRPDLDPETPHGMSLGCTVCPGQDAEGGVRTELELPAAAFLGLARTRNVACAVEDGTLKLSGGKLTIEADAQTGAVRKFEVRQDAGEPTMTLAFRPGALAERLKALDAATAAHPNCCERGRELSSFCRFLADEILAATVRAGDEEGRKRAEAAARAVARIENFMAPLDQLAAELRAAGGRKDGFSIPPSAPEPDPAAAGLAALLAEAIPRLALPAAERCFPRESWPWTLAREAALAACGKGRYTGAELGRLHASPEVGPVGCLATAALLTRAGGAAAARGFAAKGLGGLAAADFRKDARALLAPDRLPGMCAVKLIAALRLLDGDDAEALAAAAGPEAAGTVRKLLAAVRAGAADRPPAESLEALCDALWAAGLKDAVESGLRKLAAPAGGDGP